MYKCQTMEQRVIILYSWEMESFQLESWHHHVCTFFIESSCICVVLKHFKKIEFNISWKGRHKNFRSWRLRNLDNTHTILFFWNYAFLRSSWKLRCQVLLKNKLYPNTLTLLLWLIRKVFYLIHIFYFLLLLWNQPVD